MRPRTQAGLARSTDLGVTQLVMVTQHWRRITPGFCTVEHGLSMVASLSGCVAQQARQYSLSMVLPSVMGR
jgi:hypothetical protein